MKKLPLSRGLFAKVDDADFERLNAFKWHAKASGKTFYAARRVKINGKWTSVYLHHDILPRMPGLVTDHINRDSLDNRRANLRRCTQSENLVNSPQGQGGIHFCKQTGRWVAKISHNSRRIFLGRFDTVEQARKRALDARAELGS